MTTQNIEIEALKTRLEAILEGVQNGESFTLMRDGVAVAQLAPLPTDATNAIEKPARQSGLHRGVVTFISDDFDEPLPIEFWLGTDVNGYEPRDVIQTRDEQNEQDLAA